MRTESGGQLPGGGQNSAASQRSGLVTLLFTDMAGSTALKQQLGDHAGVALVQEHHSLLREILKQFPQAEEISTAGDSFFLIFPKPSDAVRFALLLQSGLYQSNQGRAVPLRDRVGLHLGEVVIEPTKAGKRDFHGLSVDVCARVMSLAQAGQILMTRPVFDSARQSLKGEEIEGLAGLEWLNHGRFELKGVQEPVEVGEVRSGSTETLPAPATSEKGRRVESAEGEIVLGWRPAVNQVVPNTQWVLEKSLGEGGFGEVWLGFHAKLKERRVFKFCFRADRARSLKRELTLFRLLKERVGEHRNIVRVLEVYFEQPPFYLEMDYAEGQDLVSWCNAHGGPGQVPLETKLEIVAQIADALQAAHQAGVIHRDVKPANILVGAQTSEIEGQRADSFPLQPLAKLTDFGIGQVISEESLKDRTRAGFTQTIMSPGSSQTGTQLYMAPELLAGKPATTRADIYSLGVVLYQLIVGDFHRPVTTDWAGDVEEPLLRDDLHHCFAGNPDARFAGAGQLAKSLRRLGQRREEQARQQAQDAERERLRQKAEHRRRVSVVIAGLAVLLLALAAALGYGLHKAQGERDQQRRLTYAADMNVAQQALQGDDLGRAKRLLESHRPRPGQTDLRDWEWRYLWQKCQSDSLGELCRYSNSTFSVSFSTDGKLLAVAGLIQFIDLWDLSARKQIARLQDSGRLVAFAPRGDILATDYIDRVRLWRAGTTNIIGEIEAGDGIRRLRFSPDGTRLATLIAGGELAVWDVGTKTALCRAKGLKLIGAHIGVLAFSPDGNAVVTGDGNRQLLVIDATSGKTNLFIPEAHPESITAVGWSPKGTIIASGSGYAGGPILLWDAASGKPAGKLEGHSSWISELIFSRDGQWLYSSSADQTIRIWDMEQGRCLSTLRGSSDEVYGLALAPDGATLASGSKDGVVDFWNTLPQSAEESPKVIPAPGASRFIFTPDGQSGALLSDRGARLLDLTTGKETEGLSMFGTNLILSLAYSPNATSVVSGGSDGRIRVWSKAERRLIRELAAGPASIPILKYRSDGKRLLSVDAEGKYTWWDTGTWRACQSFVVPGSRGAVSPDGRLAIAVEFATTVWFDAETGAVLGRVSSHRRLVSGVAFSPDGKQAATVSEDGTIALWNTATLKATTVFKGHMQGAHAVAYSPDGRRLVTGGGGRETVKVWDLATRRELLALPGRGSLFRDVNFSPGGEWVAALGMNGLLHLWRAPSWAEVEAGEKRTRPP